MVVASGRQLAAYQPPAFSCAGSSVYRPSDRPRGPSFAVVVCGRADDARSALYPARDGRGPPSASSSFVPRPIDGPLQLPQQCTSRDPASITCLATPTRCRRSPNAIRLRPRRRATRPRSFPRASSGRDLPSRGWHVASFRRPGPRLLYRCASILDHRFPRRASMSGVPPLKIRPVPKLDMLLSLGQRG